MCPALLGLLGAEHFGFETLLRQTQHARRAVSGMIFAKTGARLGRYIYMCLRDRLHGENATFLRWGRGGGRFNGASHLHSVCIQTTLSSERRTVKTVLEKDRQIQTCSSENCALLLEMASATTAAPALFHTFAPSEPTAW